MSNVGKSLTVSALTNKTHPAGLRKPHWITRFHNL